MIAIAKKLTNPHQLDWQTGFLELLPEILDQLRFLFRGLHGEERDEAMAEAVANCAIAYARLYRRGKVDVAYPSPLARFAAKQYQVGRRVGHSDNVHEITSPAARRRHGLKIHRLDQCDSEGEWKEILVEDGRCTPAELAASRIDFNEWLRRLKRQKRRIAQTLATGETTHVTAKKFRLTPGRISQIRRELAREWNGFQGAVNAKV